MNRSLAASPVALVVLTISAASWANPKPLPMSYVTDTLGRDQSEVEQYADFALTRAKSPTGESVPFGATRFQTEFEHGLTDRLELGLYVTYVPAPTDGTSLAPALFSGNGLKQRLKYKLAPSGELPVDVAIYGEVSENQREIELEGKLILQRRVGPFRAVANAVVEREIYFNGEREWVINPSGGVVWEASPTVQPGFEWWMRGEFEAEEHEGEESEHHEFDKGPHHYVGPTLLVNRDRFWVSAGAYVRVDARDHEMAPGESFAPLWIRTIVGLSL